MNWQPMATAPHDGEKFWGLVGEDAIAMFWHPTFDAYISAFRRMTMAHGYTIDGKDFKDHSPTIHHPTHWAPLDLPTTKSLLNADERAALADLI